MLHLKNTKPGFNGGGSTASLVIFELSLSLMLTHRTKNNRCLTSSEHTSLRCLSEGIEVPQRFSTAGSTASLVSFELSLSLMLTHRTKNNRCLTSSVHTPLRCLSGAEGSEIKKKPVIFGISFKNQELCKLNLTLIKVRLFLNNFYGQNKTSFGCHC